MRTDLLNHFNQGDGLDITKTKIFSVKELILYY